MPSVLIAVEIWYQMNLVPDLNDKHTRNWHQKMELICGASFCSVCHRY